ncbi:MAG: glycosyltransferase [Candidatus Omnitrophica bacterium]|nr:glycosyltransferase [Candidatus Omnitrophota bacterium]
MKIAIVHDWLTGMRGGEKCLEVFCEIFPDADIFTLIHKKGSVSPVIERMNITTSFLQKIPGIFKHYRYFLTLFPRAVRSFDLIGYDLILSSSHAVAKGARIPKNALHICYCYTPMRYAWQLFDEYFSSENKIKQIVIRFFMEWLKKWDLASNKRVDYFIAISDNVRARIKKYYKREADVIFPPVDVLAGASQYAESAVRGYYLVVSALVPYKRIDLAVSVFNESGKALKIVGAGTELVKLRKIALGNIEFLGWVSDSEIGKYYAGAEALIFPGEEDFGIVPVEAQAFGKPVIAYKKGGVLETVTGLDEAKALGNAPTGVFFAEQTVESLNSAINKFEANKHLFIPENIRGSVRKFNRDRFKREIEQYISIKTNDQRLTTND